MVTICVYYGEKVWDGLFSLTDMLSIPEKLKPIYREQEIDSELGLVIGTITESKELINHALERKGGRMNMCTALEELKKEGIQEGKIEGYIEASKGFGADRELVNKKIQETYDLNVEEAAAYMEKYW